jgi:hypothetical protein
MHIIRVNINTMADTQELAIISEVRSGDHEQYRFIVERYHRGLIQHLYNLVGDGQTADITKLMHFQPGFIRLLTILLIESLSRHGQLRILTI